MAGSLTLALRTAQSGLQANQSALNAISNNVANVNSPGYSRKIVNLEQRVVAGAGAGVQLSQLTRQLDEGLLKTLRNETSALNSLSVQDNYYLRLQELFGTPDDNTSISHTIAQFTAAIESLSDAPSKTLEQTEIVRRAKNLTTQLQTMSATIQDLRQQTDKAIADDVTTANKLIVKVGDLNDEIIARGSINRDVTDLQDQRDMALDQLAELIDIRYFSRSDGDIVVFTSGGRTLVDSSPSVLVHTAASSVSATTTHAEGDISPIYIGNNIAGNDITNEISSGRLKGLVTLRDTVLTGLQSQLDELAGELRDTMNQVHNRGVAFPGAQSLTGTRVFIAGTTTSAAGAAAPAGEQRIYLDASGSVDDVAIALLDGNGDQSAVSTLNAIMTSATYVGAYSSRGGSDDWSIANVAANIQAWIRANGAASATVAVDSNGKFAIDLNTTSLNLSFRDQTASANGSSQQDASIGFDSDGDSDVDETISGFSYFLGLNDFFVDDLAENIYASKIVSSSTTTSAATLSFKDSTGSLGSVAIAAGKTLSETATTINNANLSVTASVVPDGAGVRLRIAHDSGKSLVITQASGNTLLTDLGIARADVRVAGALSVRSDIASTPGKISRGALSWNADLGVAGEYFTSASDDTVIKALATTFTATNTFDEAGGLSNLSVNFEDYGAAILSRNASLADTNETDMDIKKELTDSLKLKSDTVRGVNIDEEMSNLLVFEQAYTASARIIGVIQRMFDALEKIL